MKLGSKLSVRFLKRTRFRSTLIILTVAISTLLMLFTFTQSYRYFAEMYQVESEQKGDFVGVFSGLTESQLMELEQEEAIDNVGRKEFIDHIRINDDDTLNLYRADDHYLDGMNIQLLNGRLPETAEEVLLSEHLIKRYGGWTEEKEITLAVGQRNYDTGETTYTDRDYKVVGIFKDLAYFDSGAGLRYEGYTGDGFRMPKIYYNRHYGQTFDLEGLMNKLAIENFQHSYLLSPDKTSHFMVMLPPVIGLLFIVVATACIAIINIFSYSIIERTRMIGLLRAVGMTRSQMKDKIRTERNIVFAIGGSIGVVFSGLVYVGWLIYETSLNKLNIIVFDMNMMIAVIVIIFIVYVMVTIGVSLSSMRIGGDDVVKMIRFEGKPIRRKRSKVKKGKNIIFHMALRKMTDHRLSFVTSFLLYGLSVAAFIVIMSLFNSIDTEILTRYYNIQDYELENDWFIDQNELDPTLLSQLHKMNGIEAIHETRMIKVAMEDSDLNREGAQQYEVEVFAFDSEIRSMIAEYDSVDAVLSENECYLFDRYEYSGLAVGDQVAFDGRIYTIRSELEYLPNNFNRHSNYYQTCFVVPELGDDAIVTHLAIDISDDYYEQVKSDIKLILPDRGVDSRFIDDTREEMESDGGELAFYSFAGMIALINFTVIINSIVTSIIYRRRDFGMLQAIGMTTDQIRKQLYIEGGFLSLVGSLVGIIGGVIAAVWLISGMAEANNHISVTISWTSVLIALVYLGVIMVTISRATAKVNELSVIENIRHQ